MNGNNICEKIQIAILSDEELSKEYKEHIENCRECKTLLSQVVKMKNGLSSLSVPGIEEGQITKAVMERVQREKTSVPFPKFKITHHIGTAAAVVVILVAALMIKNPSDMEVSQNDNAEKAPVMFSESENNHVLAGVDNNDGAEQEKIMYKFSADIGDKETADSVQDNSEMFADTADIPMEPDIAQETVGVTYDAVQESAKNTARITDASVENSAIGEDSPMLLFASPVKDEVLPEAQELSSETANSGGGGGGSYNSSEKQEEPPKMMMYKSAPVETAEQQAELLFEGIGFSLNDEDFDKNIILANEKLKELFGDKYTISREKLDALGIDNAAFVEISKTLTRENFEFYKTSFDIFE